MDNKYSNKYILETSVGLQDVDKLEVSPFFYQESQRYIKGEITLDELDSIINGYYENKPSIEDRTKEADEVSIRIAKLIYEDSFSFTIGQLLSIHHFLFNGIISNAGKLRAYNFSKKEWILDGASVTYGDYRELENTLIYDFDIEKRYNYSNKSVDEIIDHLSIFISNLWQIHAFEEGNTRTTAVFVIKYLRSLGFDVTNDTFAKNAWYFRNSLVRANYKNLTKGVVEDRSYLIKFLRNLLLNESNILENKNLHISHTINTQELPRDHRIKLLIQNNKYIKSEEIAKELGVSLRTVKTLLSNMQKQNQIKRTNGKKYGYWEIVK